MIVDSLSTRLDKYIPQYHEISNTYILQLIVSSNVEIIPIMLDRGVDSNSMAYSILNIAKSNLVHLIFTSSDDNLMNTLY